MEIQKLAKDLHELCQNGGSQSDIIQMLQDYQPYTKSKEFNDKLGDFLAGSKNEKMGLPDNVNSAIDYLEYLMTINQINEAMIDNFRSGFKSLLNEMADKSEYGISNFNRESVINKLLEI